jgi:urease accessory protein
MTELTMSASQSIGLIRLLSWLSPVFPTGGFAYSNGLERAVHDGLVRTEADLQDWLRSIISHGSASNDQKFLAEGWRGAEAGASCQPVAELALALAGSKERHLELTAQGAAFVVAVENWNFETRPELGDLHPLPVVVGAYCAVGGIALEIALTGYLQAIVSSQLQAAIRLSVLGQSGAARILAALEPEIARLVAVAAGSTLDDLGTATIMADIVSMKHETQTVRLFRS